MLELPEFRSPPKAYRPAPLLALNDDLDERELVRQIGLMDEAGWGGFFMFPEGRLVTPYLSRRWFDCIRACVTEAERRGMHAWIYDELVCPSGFAAGAVPAASPEHRSQALWCLVDDKPTRIAERLAVWVARREEGRLVDFRPVEDASTFDPETQVWVQVYPVTATLTDLNRKGYCYINVLNPEAVRAFIESTYEAYAREVGEAFGSTVPGVFTDEPAYADWRTHWDLPRRFPGARMVPWADDLPEEFRRQNGYDLISELPCLFFDTGDYTRVRYDFWRIVTLRFVESFSRQVGEWCTAHNLELTGHYMCEDWLDYQVPWIGAAMPHYEHMHLPGVDKLRRHIDIPMTVKQVDSAVCQLGKRGALCEAYGAAGQGLGFAGRKWIGDQLYALGITFLNTHLALYSMRGPRKRCYPPNLYYQQPWWPHNAKFDVHYTRLSYALSRGQRVVDVLVVHPISSAWTVYRPMGTYRNRRLNDELAALSGSLLALHRDYHFADEILLARYGSVRDGRMHVGEMDYGVVVVPPGTTLARSTVDLLDQFASRGGTVIAAGDEPRLVDGREAGRVLPPGSVRVANERAALALALDECLLADVVIEGSGAGDVLYHHRRDGSQDIFFLVNQDRHEGREVTARLPGTGRLECWDTLSGQTTPLAGRVTAGGTEVALALPPVGSLLLVMDADRPAAEAARPELPPATETKTLGGAWRRLRMDPNSLTLDYCTMSLDGGPWGEPRPVWRCNHEAEGAGEGTPFRLRFAFRAETVPSAVELVLDYPEQVMVTANGTRVAFREGDYWRDISFKRADIARHIRAGENTIEMAGVLREQPGLDDIYLIGDFGVAARRIGPERHRVGGMDFDRYGPEFTLVGEAADGGSGDLGAQGYPFFTGVLSLSQTVEMPGPVDRAVLALEGLQAVAADVQVNGRHAGTILIPPHEVEVGSLLAAGANVIEVRLVTSLRNLLGPLHLPGGEDIWTGPDEFTDKGGWTDDYIFMPFGFERACLRWALADD